MQSFQPASGLLVSAWGFFMGALLLDFNPPLSSLPALGLVVCVSVFSCTAFGLTLAGRFTIQTWTSTAAVAGLAAGAWLPRARQALLWNAKKMSKRLGGDRYLQLRKIVLGHGNEVRWGDRN